MSDAGKQNDLAIAVKAWVELFGSRLPFDELEIQDDLMQASNEKANTVTLAIRKHGYPDFRLALERAVMPKAGGST